MHRSDTFATLFASLSPASQDRAVRVLAAGGLHGAEDEGTSPAARLSELHDLLEQDEARARLTDDELGAMWTELEALFSAIVAGEAEGIQRTDLDSLRSVSESLAACAVESGGRYTAAEAAAGEIEQLARDAGLAPAEGAAEGGDDPDPELDALAALTDEEREQVQAYADALAAAGDAPTEGAPAEDPIVAGAGGAPAPLRVPSLGELNRRQPVRRTPVPVAAVGGVNEDRHEGPAFVRWTPTGEMVTLGKFHELLTAWPQSRRGGMQVGQKVVLGQVETLSAEAQRINTSEDGVQEIRRKVDAAAAGLMDPANWDEHGRPREAILASGGWNTPSPVIFDLGPNIHTTARPVDAALASVGLDRGSLTWVRQPKLTDIVTGGPGNTGAAVGVWTVADDESATDGNPKKSHQRVGTPTTVTKELEALYQSLEMGVLQSRAFPEWVRRWQELTDVAWARMAETFLLDQIEDSPLVKFISQGIVVGAVRDYLAMIISLVSQERTRLRMDQRAPVRVLYPVWLQTVVQMDLLRDGTRAEQGAQILAADYIEGQLARNAINASAYLDSSTDGGQLLPAQNDADDLNEFPTRTRSYIFHEGAFVKGDGGTLDLGVVRDADLVDTNDYRMFSESFETVLDRGEWAYVADIDVCPSGTGSAAVDIQHLCTTGS